MESNKHHFYFAIALVTIFAVGGFVMLEISNTMADLTFIEDSFYSAVRNGEARLSAEINRGIQDIDVQEPNFDGIDEDLGTL